MVNRVAPNVEPAAATSAVNPALSHPTLWIGTDKYKLGPLFVGQVCGIFWVSNMGFRTVVKLSFIARTAVWTRDMQHSDSLVGHAGSAVLVD